MIVSLHYDTEGWAYHRRCQALAKRAPKGVQVHMGGRATRHRKCDLALQLCSGQVPQLRKQLRSCRPVIVAGINTAYSAASEPLISRCLRESDHAVINSRACYEAAGEPTEATWISNGVDLDDFRPTCPPEKRKPVVLWTGSIVHRGHKGYDQILIPLARRLWKDGIQCDFRLVDSHGGPSRWSTSALADWYNTGRVMICASKSEGTPNPCLEAAACGCVLVSTRVGNMPELIEEGGNGHLVDRDVDAMHSAVRHALETPSMHNEMLDRIQDWSWDYRARMYFDLFGRLLNQAEQGQNKTGA